MNRINNNKNNRSGSSHHHMNNNSINTKCHEKQPIIRDKQEKSCKVNPVIGLIGVGCAGGYLLNKLSKKYNVLAYEAGWDRRNDGFSYNLALVAPTTHTQYDKVAPSNPLYPPGNTQWAGITFQPPYSISIITSPGYIPPSGGTGIGPQSWTVGIMVGGSNEHIQGVYVNPSESRCNWWAEILKDSRYEFTNLFPKLIATEHFRYNTDFTTQTYDGSTYGPYDGLSINGSKPINRGYEGVIQAVQASPSPFSLSLSTAIYNKFHEPLMAGGLGYMNFKLEPIVNQSCSETFNSGVNTCVTKCVETWLDKHRVRSSVARAYLNDSTMINVTPNIPSPYVGGYTGAGITQFYLNKGIQKGINGHNFILTQNSLVQRIVFETKPQYPPGQNYWINPTLGITADMINPNAFKRPLHAIGLEYADQTNLTNRIFVPCTDVICSLGTLATPALLMQSGIGPENVLDSIGVPKLFIQPNMGRHISNHAGTIIRWQGNINIWGNNPVGTDNSNGYLPGPDNPIRRKFQYFSGFNATPPVGTTGFTGPSWTMNLYDLTPKSTGFLVATQPFGITGPNGYTGGIAPGTPGGTILNVAINPNYYSDPCNEDRDNLCWLVRHLSDAIRAADPSAVFIAPNLPYPFTASNDVLFQALLPTFTAQAHYVGSCGMGPDPFIHCVDTKFLLRGTDNVRVCDASSTPLAKDCNGNIFPVQNDGNTSRGINAFSIICAEQLLHSLRD